MNISDMNEAERKAFDDWYKNQSYAVDFYFHSKSGRQEILERFVEERIAAGHKSSMFSNWVSLNVALNPLQKAWECPACGCGVRGDVEVCPHCVKRSDDGFTGHKTRLVIHEADVIKANGIPVERVLADMQRKSGFYG
jgi:rubrerythrin